MVAKNDMEEKANKQTTCKYFTNASGSNCPAEKLGLIYSLVLDIQKNTCLAMVELCPCEPELNFYFFFNLMISTPLIN